MKLSEQLKRGRIDRPDEWTMDRYIQKATAAEESIRELVAITEDMSNGKDVGNRLIAAWSSADEILEDNEIIQASTITNLNRPSKQQTK